MKQSAVLSLPHILTGTWSLPKRRHHKCTETDIKGYLPHFLIRQECTFQISWTWPFSSATTIFLHLACLGGKCYILGLFLWVDISLAVGPMSCSPSESKHTDQRPTNCSPCSLGVLWRQNSSADSPATLAIDTGFKRYKISKLFVSLIREGGEDGGRERERKEYISVAGHQLPISYWRR